MNQSSKLWSISHIASIRHYSSSDLWVLASDSEVSSRKALRLLKKAGDVKPQITNVTSRGTIDVF